MCAPLGVAGLVKSPEKAALGLIGSKLLTKKKKPAATMEQPAQTKQAKGMTFGG